MPIIAPRKSTAPVSLKWQNELATAFASRDAEIAQSVINTLAKLPPQQSRHLSFAVIGGVVVKLGVLVKTGAFLGAAGVTVSAGEATKADIEEALSRCEGHDGRVYLRNLISLIRDNTETKREPLQVQIVNAGELKSDKVIKISRDEDSGKMTGATVMNAQ